MAGEAHPYIPNSAPAVRESMLAELGLTDVEQLYSAVPARLRVPGPLDVPSLRSEAAVRRHLEGLIATNRGCEEVSSFLGGGCAQHYVPAVCDEINQRAEFLTSYFGQFYSDHGKLQALFEYASMVGELVELDAVALPTYDWAGAVGTAIRMCARMTGRATALVAGSVGPERLRVIRNYCRPDVAIEVVPFDHASGQLDLDACRALLSHETAALYVENPSYLGTVDEGIGDASGLVHSAGGLVVVGADPISLGVMAPPPSYGADIVCGDLQPLGMHMNFGGGLAGFIATPDEERYVAEHPGILIGLTSTSAHGERGFGYVRPDRTVYAKREEGNEFTGTTTGLWAITAAVYLALVGPDGLRDVGASIMQRSQYAATRIGEISGVSAPALGGPFFKEFVVRLDDGGPNVDEVNRALVAEGFYGGHALRQEFPELGESALYCVTEVHTKQSIDAFVDALDRVLARL